jgi:hypothetical protein
MRTIREVLEKVAETFKSPPGRAWDHTELIYKIMFEHEAPADLDVPFDWNCLLNYCANERRERLRIEEERGGT